MQEPCPHSVASRRRRRHRHRGTCPWRRHRHHRHHPSGPRWPCPLPRAFRRHRHHRLRCFRQPRLPNPARPCSLPHRQPTFRRSGGRHRHQTHPTIQAASLRRSSRSRVRCPPSVAFQPAPRPLRRYWRRPVPRRRPDWPHHHPPTFSPATRWYRSPEPPRRSRWPFRLSAAFRPRPLPPPAQVAHQSGQCCLPSAASPPAATIRRHHAAYRASPRLQLRRRTRDPLGRPRTALPILTPQRLEGRPVRSPLRSPPDHADHEALWWPSSG